MFLSILDHWIRSPIIRVTIFLLAALLIINAAAVWVIFGAHRGAKEIALQDLQLRTTAHARSLEAFIASLRGDFIFLSQSPQLANTHQTLLSSDPTRRRWGRLEMEGSLLLFLQAHPEIERVVVRDGDRRPLVVVGRRKGAPVLLPPQSGLLAVEPSDGQLQGIWPLGPADRGTGALEVVIDLPTLLRIAVPGMGGNFSLRRQQFTDIQDFSAGGKLSVSVPVRDEGWPTPIRWTLVCQENQSTLIESVSALASHYRTTVVLNVIVMSLALLIGVFAFRQARRTTLLESENRQQLRVRELERQVMHSERLATVGRLAAGMAHEINNPLEGMSNYLSLLEEDVRGGKIEDSLEGVERVKEGLERAAGIIRQVLTFSDPGAPASHSPVDLNETLEEAVRFVRSNPSFRQIQFVLRTSDSLRILGNRTTLGQLFLNLLLNACQLQQEGGKVEVLSWKENDRAVVSVTDNGPGIPPEVLPRIFEPFFSTRGSTGLGLSVCHGIVSEHGGCIAAEDRLNGGACFRIEFPLEAREDRSRDLQCLADELP